MEGPVSIFRDQDQTRDECSDLIGLLEQLRSTTYDLDREENEEEAARGYPTSSTDYSPPTGRSRERDLADSEDDGGKPDHGDPTPALALAVSPHLAHLRSTRRSLEREISTARKAISSALESITEATKPPVAPEDAMTVEEPAWCDNCILYGSHNPRRTEGGKVCRSCADFRRKHVQTSTNTHELPPRSIVDRQDRQGKITARDLAAAGFAPITKDA